MREMGHLPGAGRKEEEKERLKRPESVYSIGRGKDIQTSVGDSEFLGRAFLGAKGEAKARNGGLAGTRKVKL